jgi:anti-sigma B factor antagonist
VKLCPKRHRRRENPLRTEISSGYNFRDPTMTPVGPSRNRTTQGIEMATEANERSERSIPGTVTVTFAAPDSARIALCGEVDISTRPQIAEALERARGRRYVVVDLSDCTFLDSTTVGVLMGFHAELDESGGRLAVALPPTHGVVNRAVDMLGVREVLWVHDSLEDARRSLAVRQASITWLEPSRPMPVD